MLENGLPLPLSADAVDKVSKSLLYGGLYRAGTVEPPIAVELKHQEQALAAFRTRAGPRVVGEFDAITSPRL